MSDSQYHWSFYIWEKNIGKAKAGALLVIE
jgi:hypothetical protein